MLKRVFFWFLFCFDLGLFVCFTELKVKKKKIHNIFRPSISRTELLSGYLEMQCLGSKL